MRASMNGQGWRLMLAGSLCLLLLSGCVTTGKTPAPASVPEIHPGILAGYLPPDALPDSLKLLPPPPPPGSTAFQLDAAYARALQSFDGTPRWKQAIIDADLMFPEAAETFSCALGVPITEADAPHLYRLLRRTLTDAGLATYRAKDHYKRRRPFMVNQTPLCTPGHTAKLEKDGSYPSGHTAIGWAWALILSELAPDRADAVLARGRAFGESRMVCNAHWHSDVEAGRFMGSSTVSRLHANAAFRDAMTAAAKEIQALRKRGAAPTRNCTREKAALASDPFHAP